MEWAGRAEAKPGCSPKSRGGWRRGGLPARAGATASNVLLGRPHTRAAAPHSIAVIGESGVPLGSFPLRWEAPGSSPPFFPVRELGLYRSSSPSWFTDDKKKKEELYLVNICSAPICVKPSACMISFQSPNHLWRVGYYSSISQISKLRLREVKRHV